MEMQSKMAEIKNKQAEVQVKMQKLQLEEQDIELKKAEMFLKAQGMQDKTQAEVYKHQLDVKEAEIVHGHNQHKAGLDFTHKISSLLSDVYKHDSKLSHEKEMGKSKDK